MATGLFKPEIFRNIAVVDRESGETITLEESIRRDFDAVFYVCSNCGECRRACHRARCPTGPTPDDGSTCDDTR